MKNQKKKILTKLKWCWMMNWKTRCPTYPNFLICHAPPSLRTLVHICHLLCFLTLLFLPTSPQNHNHGQLNWADILADTPLLPPATNPTGTVLRIHAHITFLNHSKVYSIYPYPINPLSNSG